jgi:hypothetical protein
MKPIATAAAVLPDSQSETENDMNDIRTAEPNWQLLGDVVRKILTKTTADYLNRKDA